jgi:hypothetical protein
MYKKSKCAECGKDSHENEYNDEDINCINCKQKHSSYLKGCTSYKELMKIENEKLKNGEKEKKYK